MFTFPALLKLITALCSMMVVMMMTVKATAFNHSVLSVKEE